MDRVFLRQAQFVGFHGILPEERQRGQRFIVDLELFLDTRTAALSGSLDDTVDYGDLFALVREWMEGKPFDLLETLAETITSAIANRFPSVTAIRLSIAKPEAPIPHLSGLPGIEIHRLIRPAE